MSLTQAQRQHYTSEGYLLLPKLIDADALTAYDRQFKRIVTGELPCAPGMKVMQDVMVAKGAVAPPSPLYGVNKLLSLENDPLLFGYVTYPKLLAALHDLLGDELYTLSSNVFNKPPGVDGRHPLHQDLRYFRLRPADRIVGVWTAILPADRSRGCLAVIPGSHRGDLLPHAPPDWAYVNHGFYGVDASLRDQRVHVEMQPGDTLLFHPLLIHGSGRNRSSGFRRAISAHYAAGDCTSPRQDWRTHGQTRRV